MTDDRADREHDGDDQPVEARREHQRIVVGDHQEDDRQREIVVVYRTLLGLFAPARVRRLACQQRGHGLLLVRDDDDEDVCHHDGADQRADLGKGAAPAEHMGEGIGEADQKDVAHERQRHLVPAERRTAQRLVEQPGQHQATERDGRRGRGGEVEHRLVDQIELGPEIVDHHQQREAGEPGGIGLPFEPGKLIRHTRRRDEVLHHVIEPAAVDLPGVAVHALRLIGA